MRTVPLLALLPTLVFLNSLVAARPAAAMPFAEAGCEAYVQIQPLDQSVTGLLSTPIMGVNRNVFADSAFQQLVAWDLPSKVTAWRQRPSDEDLSRQWEELSQKWNAGNSGKEKSTAQSTQHLPYRWQALPADQWKDLEKWFAKEGPKRLPGLCADSGKAGYILAVGIISGGSASVSRFGASNPHEYEQLSAVRQQDAAVGPNAATYSPSGHESRYDELNGIDAASDPSAHTCAYLYRTNEPGGTRRPTPDYYFCRSSGEMPRSVLITMLKFLAKNGLP